MNDLFSLLSDDRGRTIQERFEQYHAAHPEVFARLVELARFAKARGKKVGIRLLWERLRWEFFIERDAGDEYKLNDHLHSRYARLIAQTYPDEFGEFFELRELKTV